MRLLYLRFAFCGFLSVFLLTLLVILLLLLCRGAGVIVVRRAAGCLVIEADMITPRWTRINPKITIMRNFLLILNGVWSVHASSHAHYASSCSKLNCTQEVHGCTGVPASYEGDDLTLSCYQVADEANWGFFNDSKFVTIVIHAPAARTLYIRPSKGGRSIPMSSSMVRAF